MNLHTDAQRNRPAWLYEVAAIIKFILFLVVAALNKHQAKLLKNIPAKSNWYHDNRTIRRYKRH